MIKVSFYNFGTESSKFLGYRLGSISCDNSDSKEVSGILEEVFGGWISLKKKLDIQWYTVLGNVPGPLLRRE